MQPYSAVVIGLLLFGAVYSSTDPCTLDYDAGPCTDESTHVIAFDKNSGKCVPKIYGGCEGNDNRFSGIAECERVCSVHLQQPYQLPSPVCALPPLLQTKKACFGYFPRFTFNAAKGACERVVYGGCGGSGNLFVSEADCVTTCLHPSQDQRPEIVITFPAREEKSNEVCSLPPIWPGPMACMAYMPKWTFTDGKCVEYVYGGCRGTGNLFDTEAECQSTCPGAPGQKSAEPTAEVCSQPIVPGPCRATKKAYGFNRDTGRCEGFVYGGCRGNSNRFSSLEECVNTCGGQEPDEEIDCSAITCDTREAKLYRAKGCFPITKQGECCPSAWDCSLWESRIENTTLCFHASPSYPLGRLYSPGETLETSTPDGCRQGCFCAGDGVRPSEIICAMVDCFQPPEFSYERCVPQYKSPQSCCAAQFKCDTDRESLGTCSLDGKLYRHGEKIFPKKEPCLACLCQAGWDGSLTAPACEPVDCGLGLSSKLRRGCEPVYRDSECCPTDWICSADAEAAVEPATEPAELYTSSVSALRPEDRCLLPQDPGTGDGAGELRFYFDTSLRQCVDFLYLGQGGNGNNFVSAADCAAACQLFASTEAAAAAVNSSEAVSNPTLLVVRQLTLFRAKSPRCMEPVQVGLCRSRLLKYFYDATSGKCATFYYSGCRGGENMFNDLRECVRTCVPAAAMTRRGGAKLAVVESSSHATVGSSPCLLPLAVGPCRALKPRWWYNAEAGDCEQFVFGGCQGNANNFATEAACQEACSSSGSSIPPLFIESSGPHINIGNIVMTLPERVGPAPSKPGGALGGGTTFSCPGCPAAVAIDAEIKKVAVVAARLLASVVAVTASSSDDDTSSSSSCNQIQLLEVLSARRQVVAGTNYILSLRLATRSGPDCGTEDLRTCSNIYVHRPLPFACPQSESPDSKDDSTGCLRIIRESDITCYANNEIVISPEDVAIPMPNGVVSVLPESRTVPEAEERCSLPAVRGPCRARIPRFYYNPESKSCQEFIYGGCRGNENNFGSVVECAAACLPAPTTLHLSAARSTEEDVCSLPAEPGPCRAIRTKFYYNRDTRQCEEFIFGGCRGNRNNFDSAAACASACAPQLRMAALTPFLGDPSAQETQRCKLDNESYAVGDMVRLNSDPCQVCVCSSPPSLTCTQKKCPLIAAVSRHRADCREVRDQLGCCLLSYTCPPAQLETDGGFPLLGGIQLSAIDHEAKIAAATAVKKLTEVTAVTGAACQHVQLIDILSVKKQVVAGTNFIFSLRLEARTGPLCQERMDRYCRNVWVYRPLAVTCPDAAADGCLRVTNPEQIECFETAEHLR